jgi:hypothetical protein
MKKDCIPGRTLRGTVFWRSAGSIDHIQHNPDPDDTGDYIKGSQPDHVAARSFFVFGIAVPVLFGYPDQDRSDSGQDYEKDD